MHESLIAAVEALGFGILIGGVDEVPMTVRACNATAAKIFGRSVEEMIGVGAELLAPSDRERLAESFASARTGDEVPLFVEVEALRPDGTTVPIEVAAVMTRHQGQVLAVTLIRDISVHKLALEALQASEARFRTIVEHAPDGVVILRGRRVAFMNGTAARLLGLPSREAGLGREITTLLPADEGARAGARIGQMIATGRSFEPSEYRVDLPDGKSRCVEIKSLMIEYEGAPAVIAFARDVSDRAVMFRDMIRADRLAAVGTLAAAVAHEINNPLTYAQLCLQYVERELAGLADERGAAIREQLRNARHGVERVATIVRDLRTFARVDDEVPGPVDLTAVIERAIKIAENDLRHRAQLVRRFEPIPAIEGTASRLEQVFLNLIINALQALPTDDPLRSEIAIELRPAGAEVIAVVADTGCGIPEEVRARVFDPFFTTKPSSEGTGLGLPVCRSIVEGIGGRIALDSTVGVGTRVTVTLRAHHAPPPEATPAQDPHILPPPRRLRILVVDDEPLVRRVLSMVLRRHHEVVVAEDGRAALAAVAAGAFDAIVCDVMMPGLSGMDVYEEIARSRPGLERRIVFVTGGAFVPRLSSFLEQVDNPKLLKPFDVHQVLNAVVFVADR